MTNDQKIAVAIPCFNEAAAIGTVIEQFRAALPGAEIVVFDNNSTDGTGAIARGLGVRVVDVPQQGKGHAVRAAFAALEEFDVVVLTDGDGTYPAEAAPLLIAPVLEELAAELGGKVRIAKLNVDENPATAARFQVRGIPTLLILKDGREVDRLVGAQPKAAIAQRLDQVIQRAA